MARVAAVQVRQMFSRSADRGLLCLVRDPGARPGHVWVGTTRAQVRKARQG